MFNIFKLQLYDLHVHNKDGSLLMTDKEQHSKVFCEWFKKGFAPDPFGRFVSYTKSQNNGITTKEKGQLSP